MVPAEHFTGYHHTNRLKDGAGGSRGSYQANTFGFHIVEVPIGATFTNVSPSTKGPEIRHLGYIYTATRHLSHHTILLPQKTRSAAVAMLLETSRVADGFNSFESQEHHRRSAWDNAPLHRVQVINTAALRFEWVGSAFTDEMSGNYHDLVNIQTSCLCAQKGWL